MASLLEIESYCNSLLQPAAFDDYCPNGLQLDGGVNEIRRLVSGVTACQGLIDAALERGADLMLVHHGYFWKGEALPLTGIKGRRIRALMQGGISLMAYHLPLDAHLEVGNNRRLGEQLGFSSLQPLVEGDGLLWWSELQVPESVDQLADRITSALGRRPLHIAGGPDPIGRIGWCTGAAQGYIEQAAAAGLDAFLSGEISEQTVHLARELGIHYYAAGHHATERFGVQALGERLSEQFGLEHRYIDIDNPV